MDCKIRFEYKKGAERIFTSNRELDEFLWEKRHTLLHNEGVSDPQAFYDIDSKQDNSIALLETIGKFSTGFLGKIYDQSNKAGGQATTITQLYEGEEAISIGLSPVPLGGLQNSACWYGTQRCRSNPFRGSWLS